jgi:hypothetical protein
MQMECCEIDELLVEYHFAAGLPTRRDRVHEHLIGCSACARRYFNLKQSIEQSAELGLRPSAKARTRLRAAVSAIAAEGRSSGGRPPSALKLVALRRFFRAPVPRYQVAAAVLLVLLGTFASRWRPPIDEERPGARIATRDAARSESEEARGTARLEGEPAIPVMVHELPSDMPPEMPIQVQPGIRPAMRGQPVHLLVLPSGRRAVVDSARSQAVSLTFY